MLSTIYIRTFLAVVEAGTYTAAADMMHMSQPAVSQHIRVLEEHLGNVRLFRRVGQRMVPTHAGEELLVAARELIRLAEHTEQNIRALRGQVSGRVVVGCTPNSGEHLLPALLAVFRERFPVVTPVIQVASGELLLNMLVQRQVSLVLIEEQQRRRGWESYMLGRERLSLLAVAQHPLLLQTEVAPGLLSDYPLILPVSGSPLRRVIEDGLRRRSVNVPDLQVVLECDSIAAMLAGVRAGVGLAFVPHSRLLAGPELQAVALSCEPLSQEWYVLRERGANHTRASQELYSFLTSPAAHHIIIQEGLLPPG